MSGDDDKTPRAKSTRARRARRQPARAARTPRFRIADDGESENSAAAQHYRREKARRANRELPDDHPLEQARRAYTALLAADAERARGGRPKGAAKSAAAKAGAAKAAANRARAKTHDPAGDD